MEKKRITFYFDVFPGMNFNGFHLAASVPPGEKLAGNTRYAFTVEVAPADGVDVEEEVEAIEQL
jgi:hypothetical protein